MTDHPQVKLNITFFVDEKLVDLLEILWKLGFITQYSCQGSPKAFVNKNAVIVFPDPRHGVTFAGYLENMNLWYKVEARDFKIGGGIAVSFNTESIDFIANMFIIYSIEGFDVWNKQLAKVEELMNDYAERSKSDESGWKDVKVFNPRQIPALCPFDEGK